MTGGNIFPQSNCFHRFVLKTKEDTRVMQVCPLLSNQMTVQSRSATSAFLFEMYINACYCADMTRSECLLIIYNISAWLQNELSRTNYLQQLVARSFNQSQTHSEAHAHISIQYNSLLEPLRCKIIYVFIWHQMFSIYFDEKLVIKA